MTNRTIGTDDFDRDVSAAAETRETIANFLVLELATPPVSARFLANADLRTQIVHRLASAIAAHATPRYDLPMWGEVLGRRIDGVGRLISTTQPHPRLVAVQTNTFEYAFGR